ncbi:MAG: GGDEF domain-containing protein [Thermoleophilia bacterium]
MRVAVLTVLCAGAAAALALLVLRDRRPPLDEVEVTWWMLALGFLVAEVAVVRIEVRRQTHTFSFTELPLVLGLLFAAPLHLVAAELLGATAALLLARRQRGMRLAFNTAQFVLTTCVVVTVFQLGLDALGAGPEDWMLWVLAIGAVLVGDLLAGLLVAIAIAASEASWPAPTTLRGAVGLGTVGVLSTTSFGLACAELARHSPLALLLLLLPCAVLIAAHRAYVRDIRRRDQTELLYRSMRRVQAAADIRAAVVELLDEARWLFRADVARIVLMPSGDGDAALRSSRGPGEAMELMVPLGPDAAEREAASVGAAERRRTLQARLEIEDRTVGVVTVTRSTPDTEPFDQGDRSLLDTYASHVVLALENGRLQRSLADLASTSERLAQAAFTDALTGLANRALLEERLDHALTKRGRRLVGVILLDLDDFKSVNDSYGHEAGDRVLVAVAGRLRASLRTNDTAARFGGDEFVLILDGLSDHGEAVAISHRIAAAFREPVDIGSRRLQVSATVGLAVGNAGQAKPAMLLADADADMYRRKHLARPRRASRGG